MSVIAASLRQYRGNQWVPPALLSGAMIMRISPFYVVLAVAVLLVAGVTVLAQNAAASADKAPDQPCPPGEPETLEISWNQPCDEGSWLFDTETGCRMWDWHPEPNDRAHWTGACKAGLKDGRGIEQWFEHGLPIDRFEGTYRTGKREGAGRYEWNNDVVYEGSYRNGVPEGHGTLKLERETFTGEWRKGCFASGGRVIAIGVQRSSCKPAGPAVVGEQVASF